MHLAVFIGTNEGAVLNLVEVREVGLEGLRLLGEADKVLATIPGVAVKDFSLGRQVQTKEGLIAWRALKNPILEARF
jgi:hypothetical protein